MISKHKLIEFKVGLKGIRNDDPLYPVVNVFDEIFENLESLEKEIEKIKNHLNIKD